MNPIWFLATRGRPDQCRDLIKAFKESGDIPEVAVMVDDDHDDGRDNYKYNEIKWPKEWKLHYSPQHMEMTWCINRLLKLYPNRSSYGFFADHFRPITPMWRDLAEAAGDWFMAWPAQVDDPNMASMQMAGAPTFGAKLIKELGWICLPTTVHIATEGPYQVLWEKLGIAKVLNRHVFRRTWPLGPDLVPRNYKGVDYNRVDIGAFLKWKRDESPQVVDRIGQKMRADEFEFLPTGRILPRYGCVPCGRTVVQPMRVMAL